tara:strand:+ start:934 stop:1122 length:189 start_codon:yes stop_codon:yes gene_type:complete
MNFLSSLFSTPQKSFQVKIYQGTKLGWCSINEKIYSEKEADKLAFYLNRIHPKNIFKADFAI